jgi:hypothetical protein
MENILKSGSPSLAKHGVLMIGFGTGLCALGSLMAKPANEQLGYVLAAALTVLCLLISISLGLRGNETMPQRLTVAYLMAGASSIACCLILWLIQSAAVDLRILGILAGILGLLWGSWYLRLAFHFQSNSIKAFILCSLAATTSSFGIIIATRSGLSKLAIVTLVGCYMIVLGVQVYLTAAFLHLEYARARVLEQQ